MNPAQFVCHWFSRGNYVATNTFTNNGGFGNPSNGDIANQATGALDASGCARNAMTCTPAANPDPNCFKSNTLSSPTSEWPALLQETTCPPGNSESPVLTAQLVCATGAASLFTQGTALPTPPPCNVPGQHLLYPTHNATASTCAPTGAVVTPTGGSPTVAVCFLPLSYTLSAAVSPSMPDPCVGVPANAFCPTAAVSEGAPSLLLLSAVVGLTFGAAVIARRRRQRGVALG
jgi:hypothetical protein